MERYCTKCGKITTKKNDSLFVCEAGHENWINPATGVNAYVVKGDKVILDQPITVSDDMSGGEPIWRDIENLQGSSEIMDEWMAAAHKDLFAWWRQNQF